MSGLQLRRLTSSCIHHRSPPHPPHPTPCPRCATRFNAALSSAAPQRQEQLGRDEAFALEQTLAHTQQVTIPPPQHAQRQRTNTCTQLALGARGKARTW